jgi:hypothetical protein
VTPPILLGASVGEAGRVRPAMITAGFVLSFSVTARALSAITRIFDFDSIACAPLRPLAGEGPREAAQRQ